MPVDAFDILKSSVLSSLKDAGAIVNNSQAEINAFFKRIEVPFNEAIASGDQLSIESFRDRVALMLGRVSFKTIYRYRQTVMATVMTVIKVLLLVRP